MRLVLETIDAAPPPGVSWAQLQAAVSSSLLLPTGETVYMVLHTLQRAGLIEWVGATESSRMLTLTLGGRVALVRP